MCTVQSLGWGLRFGHRACYRLYILDNSGSFDITFHSHPEVVKAGWSIRSITQAQICTIEAPSPPLYAGLPTITSAAAKGESHFTDLLQLGNRHET